MKVAPAVKLNAIRAPGRLTNVTFAISLRLGLDSDGCWFKARRNGSLKIIISTGVSTQAVAKLHATVAIITFPN